MALSEDIMLSEQSVPPMRPQNFPWPLQTHQQPPYPILSGYPLHPYPSQFGPRNSDAAMVSVGLSSVHVGFPPRDWRNNSTPLQYTTRVAPPYKPPPPYPHQTTVVTSPPPTAPPDPDDLPQHNAQSNSSTCLSLVKTVIVLAIIAVIASLCYYFFYLKKNH